MVPYVLRNGSHAAPSCPLRAFVSHARPRGRLGQPATPGSAGFGQRRPGQTDLPSSPRSGPDRAPSPRHPRIGAWKRQDPRSEPLLPAPPHRQQTDPPRTREGHGGRRPRSPRQRAGTGLQAKRPAATGAAQPPGRKVTGRLRRRHGTPKLRDTTRLALTGELASPSPSPGRRRHRWLQTAPSITARPGCPYRAAGSFVPAAPTRLQQTAGGPPRACGTAPASSLFPTGPSPWQEKPDAGGWRRP